MKCEKMEGGMRCAPGSPPEALGAWHDCRNAGLAEEAMKDMDEFDFFGADAYAGEIEAASLRARAGARTSCRIPEPQPRDRRWSPQPVLSVTAACTAWRRALQGAFPAAWVSGEIASITRAASGHLYFDLKDSSSRLRCVMFRSSQGGLGFEPRAGDQVEACGEPDLYARTGSLQLKVTRLRRAGLGRLYELFEALKRRLSAEGLFDAAAKRPLPGVPASVGIVSSLAAAGLRDALKTLARRAPYARIIVYPASVQGEGAASEIISALQRASSRGEVDVLLLVRGGGSFEDLAAFNAEGVARAIRACRIPVISGIGHEVDTTIADLAADLRAATPTAAAERCAPSAAELLARLSGLDRRLSAAMKRLFERQALRLEAVQASPALAARRFKEEQGRIERLRLALAPGGLGRLRLEQGRLERLGARLSRARPGTLRLRSETDGAASRLESGIEGRLHAEERRLQELALRLSPFTPQGRLALERQRLDSMRKALLACGEAMTAVRRQAMELLEARLLALDFMKILERGYAMALSESGGVIRSAASLKPGDAMQIVLHDGRVRARVLEIEPGAARLGGRR